MKPQFIFLVVLWFFSQPAICQNSAIDSLQNLVKNETDEVMQGRLYSEISLEYFRGQVYFDSAHYYNDKAYRIAKEKSILDLEARALFNRGMISSVLGKYEEAITHYLESKTIYERVNNKNRVGAAYNNIGGTYFELGKYDVAIQNYEKALEIAVEAKDYAAVGIDYMNIGEAHYIQGRYQKSKELIELSLDALSKTDFDPPTVHLFYARTLSKLGDFSTTKYEALKSFEISQNTGDLKYTSEAAQFVADIYVAEDQYEQAYEYQQISYEYATRLNIAKESNEIEKLKLNFELQERNQELAYLDQISKDETIIYLLAGVGVFLLLVLIFRQRKIVGMTEEIHTIQRRLVGQELKKREWEAENKNATAFEVAKLQDKEK